MVTRLLKSFVFTLIVFASAIFIFLIGAVFRLLSETWGYHNGESMLALFLMVFFASYLLVCGNDK